MEISNNQILEHGVTAATTIAESGLVAEGRELSYSATVRLTGKNSGELELKHSDGTSEKFLTSVSSGYIDFSLTRGAYQTRATLTNKDGETVQKIYQEVDIHPAISGLPNTPTWSTKTTIERGEILRYDSMRAVFGTDERTTSKINGVAGLPKGFSETSCLVHNPDFSCSAEYTKYFDSNGKVMGAISVSKLPTGRDDLIELNIEARKIR